MPEPPKNHYYAALSVIAISLLTLAGGAYTARLPERQRAQGRQVNHTYEVLDRLHLLALHVTEAETGQRGYLLSGQPDYLAPYIKAVARIDNDLNDLELLVADNARQQRCLAELRQAIMTKLDELKETIAVRKQRRTEESLAIALSERSKQLMHLIRQSIRAMETREEELLQSRLTAWNSAASQSRNIMLGGSSAVYVLVLAVYVALQRVARQRHVIAEAERGANAIQRAETERLVRIVKVQNEIVGQAMDLEVSMQLITEHTQALTCADGGIVELLDGDEMVYRAATGTAAPHIGLRLKAANSLSGRCLVENAVLKCDDSETDQRVDRQACRKVGLRSMVVVPLRHNGHAVGVLKVMSAGVSAFDEEDVTTLQLMAGLLSATLNEAMAANAIQVANEDLARANAHLESLASTDGLTGLKNHRTFQDLLATEYARARRYEKPLSVVIIDVDHFKMFNDTFGHPAGDAVLRRVGSLLQQTARTTDIVARYGGEEFALLLPETPSEGAEFIAERLRRAIATAGWDRRDVTVSVGVSSLEDDTPSPAALVEAADGALYTSKRNGRNRLTVASGAVRSG